jgi:hypothetical protein
MFDQVILTLRLDGEEFSSDWVARTIIEVARRGERDPVKLRARTLPSLELSTGS